MSKLSESLANAVERFTADEEKFLNGNKAAGVRARQALMEIKRIAAEGRKQLSPSRNEGAQPETAAA